MEPSARPMSHCRIRYCPSIQSNCRAKSERRKSLAYATLTSFRFVREGKRVTQRISVRDGVLKSPASHFLVNTRRSQESATALGATWSRGHKIERPSSIVQEVKLVSIDKHDKLKLGQKADDKNFEWQGISILYSGLFSVRVFHSPG
jgi:hypothetical protein